MKNNFDSAVFSLNRIVAAGMAYADFLAMCTRLGVKQIELRNDLPRVELVDGSDAVALGKLAADAGLTILTINALQRFENWNEARASEALALCQAAKALGCQALVLCPTNDTQDPRNAEQRAAGLRQALRALQPMLEAHGLIGLVEPLGFAECATRTKRLAVEAFQDLGKPACFKLVHDTFHHHLCGDATFYPEYTGLVHISGVDDGTVAVSAMRDGHRNLVGVSDKLGTVEQLQTLLAAGYRGAVSFEPFAEGVIHAENIESMLKESMDYLKTRLVSA